MRRSPLNRRTPLRSLSGLKGTGRLNPVSPKRRRDQREYTRLRAAFLEGRPLCEWPEGCVAAATDVHHMRGRGSLYLEVSTWLPLCRAHHVFTTEHPLEAYRLGVSEKRIGGEAA